MQMCDNVGKPNQGCDRPYQLLVVLNMIPPGQNRSNSDTHTCKRCRWYSTVQYCTGSVQGETSKLEALLKLIVFLRYLGRMPRDTAEGILNGNVRSMISESYSSVRRYSKPICRMDRHPIFAKWSSVNFSTRFLARKILTQHQTDPCPHLAVDLCLVLGLNA